MTQLAEPQSAELEDGDRNRTVRQPNPRGFAVAACPVGVVTGPTFHGPTLVTAKRDDRRSLLWPAGALHRGLIDMTRRRLRRMRPTGPSPAPPSRTATMTTPWSRRLSAPLRPLWERPTARAKVRGGAANVSLLAHAGCKRVESLGHARAHRQAASTDPRSHVSLMSDG